MESQGMSLGYLSRGVFAFAEYLTAFFVEHTVGDKFINPCARLKRGIELEQWLWPEEAGI
jgi:hypothetical protein